MKVSYNPKGINNFHNSKPINLVLNPSDAAVYFDQECYNISKYQAKRIEKHFCGVSSCGCPKGAVTQLNPEGTEFCIRKEYCEVIYS